MATWRLARSLDVLTGEIRSRWPGTTVWTIGDQAHRATWSDHNPNAAGVVCAVDVLGNGGMSLAWFAARVVATDPPALKYVIYNRRIWLPGYGWNPYNGSNPHSTHVHVSVGQGPDGRTTGPYDDRSPWGIKEEEDMALSKEDAELIAAAVWAHQLPNPARAADGKPRMQSAGSWQRYADHHQDELVSLLRELPAAVVAELGGRPPAEVAAALIAALGRDAAAQLVDELLRKIAAGPTP